MRFATLSLACILFISSEARKFIIPFEVLLFQAEEIVTGKVLEIHNEYYLFEISKAVYKTKNKVIKVQHFREWTCDKRRKKLELGQELLLLLEKKVGRYYPLNASSGEIYIINNKISVSGIFKEMEFDEKAIITSLTDALYCYKLKHPFDKSWYYIPAVKRTKSDEQTTLFRNKSPYSELIFDAIEKHISKMID